MKIISTRKKIFLLSLPPFPARTNRIPRVRGRVSSTKLDQDRREILFATNFFFSFTREENCSVITDIPSGRGDEYNGGILFVVSIYEFSSNDNSPPGGRREQRPPFFSLSLSFSEKRFEKRRAQLRGRIWKKRGFKLPLVLSSVRERSSDENWNVVAENARNISSLFCPGVFVEKVLCSRFFVVDKKM